MESKVRRMQNRNLSASYISGTAVRKYSPTYEVERRYVYKVATEELGMVKADRSQIKTYTNSEKEYVRQYEDIP